MSTEISLPKGFGLVASVFTGNKSSNDELGAGVASSYGVIGYKGKVWSTRYQGTDVPLMRDDGDGPRGSIEVVIIKASPAVSKIYYKGGYVEGSSAAPDCWSASGVTPDASVQNKVHPICADCPMNAWGSRITESGKPGKACSDSRRLAVVPLADIDNEPLGGPMLLRVPAASLKDLKAYGDLLNGYQYPYFAVATRISFDPKEAYPKFVFSAIRPLTEEEGVKVVALRDDKRVATVLSEAPEAQAVGAAVGVVAQHVPASPFEQPVAVSKPAPAPKATAQETSAAAEAAKKAALAEKKRLAAEAAAEAARLAALAAEEEEDDGMDDGVDDGMDGGMDDGVDDGMDGTPVTQQGNAPDSFDDMLSRLL